MAATYPADTFQEGVDLTIEASNQLAQVVRGDANTEVMVADGSTIPSIRKAQTDSMYFKEPETWTTGQTETDYLQLKKYTHPTTGKESWWFAKGALVSNPIAMGTSPFGNDNWTLYTPEDLFISGKAEYESIYQALKGKAAEAGYNLVRGSFEEGGTLTNTNDVLWYQSNGRYYSWAGTFPKVVAAGATPATAGGIGVGLWSDKTDLMLRSDINIVQKRFSCVADAVADTSLTIGKIVETIGYHNGWVGTSDGPKGGNRYEVVAGGTGVADGGSYINTSNGLQLKGLFINGTIDICQFGAISDLVGMTESSTQIQNAINFVGSGKIQIPKGRFVAKNLTFTRFLSEIAGEGNGSVLELHASGGYLLSGQMGFGDQQTIIKDLILQGNMTGTGIVLGNQAWGGLLVSNVFFRKFHIAVDKRFGNLFNVFESCCFSGNGIDYRALGCERDHSGSDTFNKCQFEENSIAGYYGFSPVGGGQISFNECIFEFNDGLDVYMREIGNYGETYPITFNRCWAESLNNKDVYIPMVGYLSDNTAADMLASTTVGSDQILLNMSLYTGIKNGDTIKITGITGDITVKSCEGNVVTSTTILSSTVSNASVYKKHTNHKKYFENVRTLSYVDNTLDSTKLVGTYLHMDGGNIVHDTSTYRNYIFEDSDSMVFIKRAEAVSKFKYGNSDPYVSEYLHSSYPNIPNTAQAATFLTSPRKIIKKIPNFHENVLYSNSMSNAATQSLNVTTTTTGYSVQDGVLFNNCIEFSVGNGITAGVNASQRLPVKKWCFFSFDIKLMTETAPVISVGDFSYDICKLSKGVWKSYSGICSARESSGRLSLYVTGVSASTTVRISAVQFIEFETFKDAIIFMDSGVFMDAAPAKIQMNTIPSVGTYIKGTTIDYTSPSAGGFLGQVCITGGTFGSLISRTASTSVNKPYFKTSNISGLTVGDFITFNSSAALQIKRLPSAITVTSISADSPAGQPILNITSSVGFKGGDNVVVGYGTSREEYVVVDKVDDGRLTMMTNLQFSHSQIDADSVESVGVLSSNTSIAYADAVLQFYPPTWKTYGGISA